ARRVQIFGTLEVELERQPAARDDVFGPSLAARPLEAHDIGSHVGEQHGRIGRRAQSGELKHAQSAQRSPRWCFISALADHRSYSVVARAALTIGGHFASSSRI